jgi:hypothetical protein
MANTWVKIISGNFSGGGGTISSIPATYDDLALLMSARDTTAGTGSNFIRVRFNSDTSSVYSGTLANNNNSNSAASSRVSGDTVGYSGWINYGGNTAGTFASSLMYIPNYKGTTGFKTWSADGYPDWNSTSGVFTYLIAGLWRNTAAINRMDFFPAVSFDALTTFTLYGIKKTA